MRWSLTVALVLAGSVVAAQPPALAEIELPVVAVPREDARAPHVPMPEAADPIERSRLAKAAVRGALSRLEARREEADGTEKGRLTVAIGALREENGDLDIADAEYASVVEGRVAATAPDVVKARMRQGYIDIVRKDRPAALEHFAPIASGEIAADVATATDAALRVAALHRLLKNWREAEHAWREVAAQTPIAERARYARLQICGLLVETAKGDYGPLPGDLDKRTLLTRAIEESQELAKERDIEPETQAIAESIEIWALAMLDDWRAVNDLAMPYLERWGAYMAAHPYCDGDAWDPGRQVVTVQTWLLMSQFRLGEFEACKRTARMIRSGAWTKEVPYANFSAFEYAYAYEIACNEVQQRRDEGQKLRQEALERYPATFAGLLEGVQRRLGLPVVPMSTPAGTTSPSP